MVPVRFPLAERMRRIVPSDGLPHPYMVTTSSPCAVCLAVVHGLTGAPRPGRDQMKVIHDVRPGILRAGAVIAEEAAGTQR